MKNVIDELKATFILTKEEIERIKLYVVKKYPNNSSKENANILSTTIYGILDKSLQGINRQQRQNIKKSIIRSTILKEKKNILKWDVFNACISEMKKTPQLKTSLIEWVNKNQKNTVSQANFEEYVFSLYNKISSERLHNLNIKLPKYKVIYIRDIKRVILKCKMVIVFKVINSYKRINMLVENISNKISSNKISISILALLILILYSINIITGSNIIENKNRKSNNVEQIYATGADKYDLYVKDAMSYHPHLPNSFNYKNINEVKLLEFLNGKNSMLAEEPYFSAIIRTSKEFNLNPNILFAITGQEQSFVPRNHENAEKIANNPFNVFHSWQEYNTDIYDSSRIVARTVINLSKDKPNNIDIFDWINSKYADDNNWGRGVKEIFDTIN